MYLIIDRFEDGFAVCEAEGKTVNLPIDRLPEGAREGDALRIDNDIITIDAMETQRRKQEILKLLEGIE